MPFKKSQTYIIFKKLNYSIYHKEYQSAVRFMIIQLLLIVFFPNLFKLSD